MQKILTILLACSGFIGGQTFEYVGTHKCKTCHQSDKKGAQYKVWLQNKHAQAFESLLSEEALKVAQEQGLTLPPHQAPQCLECHTVGFGRGGYEIKDEAFYNPDPEDKAAIKAAKRMENLKNVGCETCHGPGGGYKSMKAMKAIFAGTEKGADLGLVAITEETCRGCHNEKSPFYKPFNFEESKKKTAHPYPPEMRVTTNE